MKLNEVLKRVEYNIEQMLQDSQTVHSTVLGTYLGYSVDSIIFFIKRKNRLQQLMDQGLGFDEIDSVLDDEYQDASNPFDGTGLIPSPKERNEPFKTTDKINKRRWNSTPFRFAIAFGLGDDIDDFVTIKKELKTNQKFRKKCIKNIKRIERTTNLMDIDVETYKKEI